MSSQDNVKIVRSMYDAFNSRAYDKAAGQVSNGFEWLNVPFGITFKGPGGVKQFMQGWATSVPDSKTDVKNLAGADEYVFSEFFFRGTHTAPLIVPGGTISATGRKVDVPVCEIFHLKDGKIDSIRTYFDVATMLRQLGLMTGAIGAQQGAQPSP